MPNSSQKANTERSPLHSFQVYKNLPLKKQQNPFYKETTVRVEMTHAFIVSGKIAYTYTYTYFATELTITTKTLFKYIVDLLTFVMHHSISYVFIAFIYCILLLSVSTQSSLNFNAQKG